MKNENIYYLQRSAIAIAITAIGITACEKQGYSVLASTGTVIGVEISQNQASQSPQAKLGYNRAEFALVPTNRGASKDATGYKNGATDTGEVVMELRYGGIFDVGGSSGIYQRLAVGKTAVQQPGAKYMFAKDEDGTLSPAVASAIALDGIKTATEDELAQKIVDEDLKDEADRKTMKDITSLDYGKLSKDDFSNIQRITGLDSKVYTQELHQSIGKILAK